MHRAGWEVGDALTWAPGSRRLSLSRGARSPTADSLRTGSDYPLSHFVALGGVISYR
jgi:hypothetical protein